MQLHDILVKTKSKKKRVGRGGKRGTTSGRGTKGQKARAGRKIRPQMRDTIKKIPKLRGVKFPTTSIPAIVVSLEVLENNFKEGEKVTPKTLVKRGLIDPPKGEFRVKVLGKGKLSKKLIFENIDASKYAAEAIMSAGGEIRHIDK